MEQEPKTLQQVTVMSADPDKAREYVQPRRWSNGVVCPTCGSEKVTFQPKHNRWQCTNRHPRRQFTLKTGTVMEDSPLGLDKWLMAMWLVASNRNGISSWELSRAIGITQKSAWFLLHRIRLAMQDEHWGGMLGGEVEADETFIGGKARNMHKDKRAEKITGTGGKDKTAVMGILERGPKSIGSKVRVKVIDNTKKKTLQSEIREHVLAGSAIFTDALQSYSGLDEFQHEVVDHAVEYVRGEVHTNGLENFWSLLKRGIRGTYVSV